MISAGIFRQYDIRGVVGTELTADAAYAIGRGFGAMLDERRVTKRMVVSRDNRPSGTALSKALVSGLRETGVDVIDVGIVPTPLMYWCLHNLPVFAGIQITGSHNPPEFNGFKVCIGHESVYGDALQHLLHIIQSGVFPNGAGAYTTEDVVDRYVDDMVTRTGALPKRLKVVFDSGNGTGGPVMTKLFARLNVEPTYLFAESDGTFPNHHPDPTVVANVQDLIAEVKKQGADMGIAFDGDADRIGAVDEAGEVIYGDLLLLIYGREILTRKPGATIIGEVKCSQLLYDELKRLGVAQIFGLSTQDTAYQLEAAMRLHLPFAILSDEKLALTKAIRLPTFTTSGMTLLKRMALVIDNGMITKAFYPVFPPDKNAEVVIAWLQSK